MASTLEKIKTLLSTKEESKEIKMYAEMILDDGRVLATEDEQFMIGSEVYVVGDDGETSKLSAGSYTMSDGAKMTIDDDSKIVDLGEEKEAEGVEEASKEEMADAEDTDWAKTFEEMKDRVAALEKEVFGDKAEEETEEMSKEETEEVKEEVVEEEKIEMSIDAVNSLVEEVEHLKAKVIELEKTPGAEGFTHNPENDTTYKEVDLTKLSSTERAAHYINNLK
jgi:hypothetical protein